MDLSVADYYDICGWELTGEGGFEHLKECLAFLVSQCWLVLCLYGLVTCTNGGMGK